MENLSNADIAAMCLKKANRARANGDIQLAKEYLLQAESLHPSDRAKKLLESLEAAEQKQNGPTVSANPMPRKRRQSDRRVAVPPQNGPRLNRRHDEQVPRRETREQPAESPTSDYTEEQINAVNRILKCKNIYDILGISKDASMNDVKKAYMDLALLVHPDKNHAPGATQAFQMIGNAVEILKDEDKRKAYDLKEEQEAAASEYYDYRRGFETRLSPEEVFAMFFGGLVVAGGYAGYKVGSAISRNRQQQSEEERSKSPEVTAAEGIGTVVGVAASALAGVALWKAFHH